MIIFQVKKIKRIKKLCFIFYKERSSNLKNYKTLKICNTHIDITQFFLLSKITLYFSYNSQTIRNTEKVFSDKNSLFS